MPENVMQKIVRYKEEHGMGKILGMTVFRGFFSLSSTGQSSNKVKRNFENATELDLSYDLSYFFNINISPSFSVGYIDDPSTLTGVHRKVLISKAIIITTI